MHDMLLTELQLQPRTYRAFRKSAVQVQTDKETKRAMVPEAGGGEEGGGVQGRKMSYLGKSCREYNTFRTDTWYDQTLETVRRDGCQGRGSHTLNGQLASMQ